MSSTDRSKLNFASFVKFSRAFRGVLKMSRVGSGRVRIKYLFEISRVGSGQEVFRSRGSGQVWSRVLQILRVGSGQECFKSHGSGRVRCDEEGRVRS